MDILEDIDSYRKVATTVGASAFAQRFPYPFLLRRPDGMARMRSDHAIPFRTRFVGANVIDPEEELASLGAWVLRPITKRAGNPFPERVSLGRAPNCDIVLRVSFVSKLHAHFLVAPSGSLSIVDQKSSNGTAVNDRAISAGVAEPVAPGDTVRFGKLVMEVVKPDFLHRLLIAL